MSDWDRNRLKLSALGEADDAPHLMGEIVARLLRRPLIDCGRVHGAKPGPERDRAVASAAEHAAAAAV